MKDAGVPGEEDPEDKVLLMVGLVADADGAADADAGLAKSLAPTVLVLVTLPSSIRHLSLSASPVEEVVDLGVAMSSISASLPPRMRLVEVSRSR